MAMDGRGCPHVSMPWADNMRSRQLFVHVSHVPTNEITGALLSSSYSFPTKQKTLPTPPACLLVYHGRCFIKSLPRSLFYMARDMGCVLALQYLYPMYVAGSWPLTLLWWNANGFMLWALFVIGEQQHNMSYHYNSFFISSTPSAVFPTDHHGANMQICINHTCIISALTP